MKTRNTHLLVFDTPKNFVESKKYLGSEGSTYKSIKNVNSKEDVFRILNELKNTNSEDLVFLAIHVFSESLNGVREFSISGIVDDFPNLKYKFITNQGKINEMCKEAIDKDLPLCKIDIFNYHGINDYLNQEKTEIPTVDEVLIGNIKFNSTKKGVFLSHSSKDEEVLTKFRDIILVGGLGVSLDEIMLTSDEATAIKEGKSIPDEINYFLKHRAGLFIQFVSDDYIKSRVCLNEEGAAWVLVDETSYITIILKGFTTSKITWVKTVDKGIKIENKDSLLNLYDNRKDFFDDVNVTHYAKKVEEFLEFLKMA